MNFEIIQSIRIEDKKNPYKSHSFTIYKETSTKVLWVQYNDSSLSEMHDPETGLPLTYVRWLENYKI